MCTQTFESFELPDGWEPFGVTPIHIGIVARRCASEGWLLLQGVPLAPHERGSRWSRCADHITLAVAPDGNTIFRAVTNTIDTWLLPDGSAGPRFEEHRYLVISQAVPPDGARLLTGSQDGTGRRRNRGK